MSKTKGKTTKRRGTPRKLIILLSLVTTAILIGSFFFTTKNQFFIISISMNIVYFILFCSFICKTSKLNNYYSQIFDLLNLLIKKSFHLLNSFYVYYDNSFLVIQNIFSEPGKDFENSAELNLLEKMQNVKELFTKLNQEFDSKRIFNHIDLYKEYIQSIEDFDLETSYFIELIQNTEKPLLKDIIQRLEVYKDKDFFQRVVVEFNYYSKIITQFIMQYVHNSIQLSSDFSEQIFDMKQNIKFFINNIKDWKNNFFDEQSALNFDKVIQNYEAQNNQMTKIYQYIDTNYNVFEKELLNVSNMVEKIFENTNSIKDIADKINILALNASIEASRSEKGNKGFKVIASEVKSLANYTKSFVTNIMTIIKDTKFTVIHTLNDFKESSSELSLQIKSNKNQLKDFYTNLKTYYENFNSMFESVSELTTIIEKHIDKFNILIQNYDIEEQQMNNLVKIFEHFKATNKSDIDLILSSFDESKGEEILKQIIDFIERVLTTANEHKILNTIKLEYNLIDKITTSNDTDIELF